MRHVHAVGHLLVALLAHHQDVLAQTVYVEVAHCERLHDGNPVLCDLLHAGSGIAEHGERHVRERHVHNGIATQVRVNQHAFDARPYLLACQSLHGYFPQHGKVYCPVCAHRVRLTVLRSAGAVRRFDVEELSHLLVAAMHVDLHLVALLEANIPVVRRGYFLIFFHVL